MRRIAHTRKEVMTNAMLFGLYLTPLFNAIAQVESQNGTTSRNIYQIQDVYLEDLGRIYTCHYSLSVKEDKFASEAAMFDYWHFYAHQWAKKNHTRAITYEVLARIHNCGLDGMTKVKATHYWLKVRPLLIKELRLKGLYDRMNPFIDTSITSERNW